MKYIIVKQTWIDDDEVENQVYYSEEPITFDLIGSNIQCFPIENIKPFKVEKQYRCVYDIITGLYTISDFITDEPINVDPSYPVANGVWVTTQLGAIKQSKEEAIVACTQMATKALLEDPMVDASSYFGSVCPWKWVSRTYLENNDWKLICNNFIFDFKAKAIGKKVTQYFRDGSAYHGNVFPGLTGLSIVETIVPYTIPTDRPYISG